MRGFVTRDFDLILALHRPGKVVVHLHAQPGIRGAAESLLQSDGHFRSDARFAINKVIQSLAAHTENLGSGSDGKSERYQAIVPDNPPRMRGIFHGHEYSPFLMVVNQVDVASAVIFETENNPPVGAHRDGPVSLPIAFELVQGGSREDRELAARKQRPRPSEYARFCRSGQREGRCDRFARTAASGPCA